MYYNSHYISSRNSAWPRDLCRGLFVPAFEKPDLISDLGISHGCRKACIDQRHCTDLEKAGETWKLHAYAADTQQNPNQGVVQTRAKLGDHLTLLKSQHHFFSVSCLPRYKSSRLSLTLNVLDNSN